MGCRHAGWAGFAFAITSGCILAENPDFDGAQDASTSSGASTQSTMVTAAQPQGTTGDVESSGSGPSNPRSSTGEVDVGGDGGTGATDDGLIVSDAGDSSGESGRECATPWWNVDWAHRGQLKIPGPASDAALDEVPIPVRLDAGVLDVSQLKADAGDLVFLASDHTTVLPHEVERWDPQGTSLIWVRVPTIDPSGTSIWVYWGGAENQVDAAEVWSNGFAGVWHLSEATVDEAGGASHLDSTGHGLDGEQLGNESVDGRFAGAQGFDGQDDTIIIDDTQATLARGGLDAGAASLTISAWVIDSNESEFEYQSIFWKGGDNEVGYALEHHRSNSQVDLWMATPETVEAGFSLNASSVEVLPATGWHHVAGVIRRTDALDVLEVYFDGDLVGELADDRHVGESLDNAFDAAIGGLAETGRLWSGVLDEVRVSSVARSASWIAFQHALGSPEAIQFVLDDCSSPAK